MLELESQLFAYALIVLPIASVHLWLMKFADRFADHEDAWMGFVGGVALGYVMIYMLPKLSMMTLLAREMHPDGGMFVHNRAYLVLLTGVIAYIAIDRLSQSASSGTQRSARMLDYSIHGIYHLLAGYIAVELPSPGLTTHILISIILVLHVMGMSNLLRHKHPNGYPHARWFMSALVLLGGTAGLVTELPKVVVNVTTAFLCGIIILNVVAEELPTGRKEKFYWFLLGIGVFLAAGFVIAHYVYQPELPLA